jgi:hypothetical protein
MMDLAVALLYCLDASMKGSRARGWVDLAVALYSLDASMKGSRQLDVSRVDLKFGDDGSGCRVVVFHVGGMKGSRQLDVSRVDLKVVEDGNHCKSGPAGT